MSVPEAPATPALPTTPACGRSGHGFRSCSANRSCDAKRPKRGSKLPCCAKCSANAVKLSCHLITWRKPFRCVHQQQPAHGTVSRVLQLCTMSGQYLWKCQPKLRSAVEALRLAVAEHRVRNAAHARNGLRRCDHDRQQHQSRVLWERRQTLPGMKRKRRKQQVSALDRVQVQQHMCEAIQQRHHVYPSSSMDECF
jgi:hypothetical protein